MNQYNIQDTAGLYGADYGWNCWVSLGNTPHPQFRAWMVETIPDAEWRWIATGVGRQRYEIRAAEHQIPLVMLRWAN